MKFARSVSFVGFFLIIGLGFMACSGGKGAVVHQSYPEGFSLDHPRDWTARVADGGMILVSAGDSADPAFIAVRPFLAVSAVTSREWLEQNLGNLGDFIVRPVLDKTVQLRSSPDETAAGFRFTRAGISCRGTALCSIDGKSGVLYILAAREDEFEVRKPGLLASLRSFRFGLPEKGVAAAPAKPAVSYVSWQDPVEQAFSMDVPAGWQVQGGTVRRASVDVVHSLYAASPDGKAFIQFNDGNIPAFALPNRMLEMTGFREGSWYSPGYGVRNMVMRYQPGLTFLTGYLQQNVASRLPGFQMTEQKDRPDIVADFNRIYAQSQAYGFAAQLHAGDATFHYGQGGEKGTGYGLAVTHIVQSIANGVGNWTVAFLLVMAAPDAEADTVKEIGTHMFQTIRMNPQWVAGQQQLTGDVSRIVSETGQAISGIISDTYERRQGSLDEIHRKFSNATLGVTDVKDPETGETYKVEAGHNYYWSRGGTNQIVGTRTFTRPDIDFTPLEEF
jgi:hypothetical protein